MDINRARKQTTTSGKAIDGFFVRPTGHQAPTRRAVSTPSRPAVRKVDGFGRSDGFYAAPRRGVSAPITTEAPARHAKASAPILDAPANSRRKQLKKAKAARSPFRSFVVWGTRAVVVGLVLILVVGGLLFGKGYFKLKKVFNGSSSAAALQSSVDPTKLKGEGDGRVNILLLGVGGSGHDGGDLTDTIMIASIDPVNNQAVLFSVPRDLWVKMPNNYIANYQKLNAAYESGKYKYLGKQDISNANSKAVDAGFAAVDSTVERVMGVPIHYNLLVNFQAFKQAIDTVGGVTVNAPEQLYDPTMAWENDRSPVLAKLGINTFDGKHALNYVRSRETTSDFSRSQRQRAVMLALKEKVVNAGTLANPVKISNLLSAFGDNVKSDISLNDMTRLASIAKKISNDKVQSVGLADTSTSYVTTGNINGLSVVQPKAGLEDYTAIQSFVRSKLKDGYISQENAKVTVLNGTVTPGLATEKAADLKSYGYNVGTVDNAPTNDFTTTQIIDTNPQKSKKYTLNYLKNRYHITSISTTLPTGIVRGGADIVIILGSDAAVSTQN
jgi:LCP family protein required for cell wall assembly